jgi:hypothetical protein
MTWKDYLKSFLWGILTIFIVWILFVFGGSELVRRFFPSLVTNVWFNILMIFLWIFSFIAGLLVSAWRASIYSKK